MLNAATPRITFVTPANGTVVKSPTPIRVAAVGSAPSLLTLYVDGKLSASGKFVTSLSYTATMTPGSHTLKARGMYSTHSYYWAVITVTVPTPPTSGGGTGGGSSTTVAAQIGNDMLGSNEGAPHGVPSSWDFARGPVLGEGNNIAPNSAVEVWTALYVGPNGNPATNTLINVKNCAAYVLSTSSGQWASYPLTADSFGSGFYAEDFSVDYGTSVPTRMESDGSYSYQTPVGKVAHFYSPWPRIAVKNTDLGGVVTTCDARLVLNNPSGIDDRGIASFLFETGADPYPTTTGAGIENNPSIGNGKFKYVETAWRSFSMSTISEQQLAVNPPPVSFAGINP